MLQGRGSALGAVHARSAQVASVRLTPAPSAHALHHHLAHSPTSQLLVGLSIASSRHAAAAAVAQREGAGRSGARPHVRVQSSSGAAAAPAPGSQEEPSGDRNYLLYWVAAAALVGGALYGVSTPFGQVVKESLVNGPLGKSGFLAAFSLILVSEIGDKTFFIAALLAMKLGKWISFLGSVTSLGVMTIISVSIGVVCSRVPDALKSSIPVGELAGIALLLFFGVKALRDGLKKEGEAGHAEEEMADAEDVVKQAETSGRLSSPMTSFFEVATLIFIAEWGDRSMLATVALGAAQNPLGVAAGAIAGHAIATGIAVLGGAIASKYISEKTINIVSGVLFILFAIATGISML